MCGFRGPSCTTGPCSYPGWRDRHATACYWPIWHGRRRGVSSAPASVGATSSRRTSQHWCRIWLSSDRVYLGLFWYQVRGRKYRSSLSNPSPSLSGERCLCVLRCSICLAPPAINRSWLQFDYNWQKLRLGNAMWKWKHTLILSWKLDAWYWAYLAMVVMDLCEIHAHARRLSVGSQFSSGGCCNCVRTSTGWSGLASTSVLVEKRPKSVCIQKKSKSHIVHSFALESLHSPSKKSDILWHVRISKRSRPWPRSDHLSLDVSCFQQHASTRYIVTEQYFNDILPILRADAIPRTTAMGCWRQNSCSW